MNWFNWYLKVLKQYADFKGRARRKEFWIWIGDPKPYKNHSVT